eukprot:CAMPEP_0185353868 /NCGR_PEP_ID=MMETSP1364-20130426/4843_1 /TAXON_ID=38817 /ORGANISM="Gephyrocapsa oceanica, Strain RCC1303" /LENGTH=330 /DNA_ID=CAMNT_0027953515 /DNA_START=238 /DNA_END=1231 /DNA_ORIENTATION=-
MVMAFTAHPAAAGGAAPLEQAQDLLEHRLGQVRKLGRVHVPRTEEGGAAEVGAQPTIDQHQTVDVGASEGRRLEVGPVHVCGAEGRVAQVDALCARNAQLGAVEHRAAQVCARQRGAVQVRAEERRAAHVAAREEGAREVALREARADQRPVARRAARRHLQPRHVALEHARAVEQGAAHRHASQGAVRELGVAQVGRVEHSAAGGLDIHEARAGGLHSGEVCLCHVGGDLEGGAAQGGLREVRRLEERLGEDCAVEVGVREGGLLEGAREPRAGEVRAVERRRLEVALDGRAGEARPPEVSPFERGARRKVNGLPRPLCEPVEDGLEAR